MSDERIGHEPIVGRRTGVLIGAALLVANVSNYAFQVLAGRSLSIESYGLLAGFMAAVTVITVSTSALQTTAAQALAAGEAKPGRGSFDRLTRSALVVAVAAGAVVVVVSPLLRRLLNLGLLPVLLLAAYITPASVDSIAAGRFQGRRRFGALAIYSASQAIAKLAVAVALLAIGWQVTGLLGGIIASSAVVAFVGLLATNRAGSIGSHVLSPDARRAFLAITAFWAITSVDVVIAHAVLPARDAGIYAAAAVLGKAVLWLPTIVSQLVFPTLAAASVTPKEARAVVRRAETVVLGIALATVIGLFLLGPTVYRILYGERYVVSAELAWRLGLAMVPMALLNLAMFQGLAIRSTAMVGVLMAAFVVEVIALSVVSPSGTWFAVVIGVVGFVALFALELLLRHGRLSTVAKAVAGDPGDS